MTERKEVKNIKIATSLLAAVLFTGTLGALNNAIAAERSTQRNHLLSREVPGDPPGDFGR
jgi:hypothetical protein